MQQLPEWEEVDADDRTAAQFIINDLMSACGYAYEQLSEDDGNASIVCTVLEGVTSRLMSEYPRFFTAEAYALITTWQAEHPEYSNNWWPESEQRGAQK